ncbi:hypothetical protein AX16_004318 [Volvariella volvacea WC 439]|nr:hypothetical protein AX16_004318 [Volvariella volvacea WC 439]
MPTAYPLPTDLSPATVANTASLLRIVSLALISGAAIASRLFAVINFESVIHEFDPWFNYRATRVLASKGFYEFWNWFDPTAWYPLGRVVGGTVYPGLMATSGVIYNFLHALNLPVDIRNICVLLAPGFSALTAWATYMFTKEMKDESAGLLAAAFIGIAPGYISRSVAGSYDNEAIAIFLLMFTFYLWIKALKQGSALFGTIAAIFYFYMVAAWGGYVFITNMIPLHSLVLILMGRFTSRLYVAYSSWYAIGTLASMQVPFVGFQPVKTSEHMAALGVFGLLQIVAFAELVRSHVSSQQFQRLLYMSVSAIGVLGALTFAGMTYKGWIAPWTGRFYSLWDTGYAKKYIPIIASVSEHQPTAWPSFFMDLNFLIFLFPVGVVLCFQKLRDEHLFVIVYSVMASYFASVMVRLMLTLTPVVCVTSAIALSSLLDTYIDPVEPDVADDSRSESAVSSASHIATNGASAASAPSTAATTTSPPATPKKAKKAAPPDTPSAISQLLSATHPSAKKGPTIGVFGLDTRLIVILNALWMLCFFVVHCTYVTSTAYSSPSVVLASQNADGSPHIIDDFREAYYWLRQNTPEDSVVMSWWDYGYQIAGMADRPTLVDNNTWNNTHIATVGKAMASSEEVAYPILRKHDVDYVLVIFGALVGYSGDDINKFLWMVRIAQGVWPDEIQEPNYFTPRGEYRIDEGASSTMKNSLMYKMSYYRFAELFGNSQPVDRVRGQKLPKVGPTLDYLEEAFTSENWIVRIYKVKKEDTLGRDLKTANAFSQGKKRKRSDLSIYHTPESINVSRVRVIRTAKDMNDDQEQELSEGIWDGPYDPIPVRLQTIINYRAMYYSEALSDFRCLHGTRTNHQNDIIMWVQGGDGKVFLLDGPIGMGKTALCQSTAGQLQGTLCGGTYFINPSNLTDDFLMMPVTLAYGLSKNFPLFGQRVNKLLQCVTNAEYSKAHFEARWGMTLEQPFQVLMAENIRPNTHYLMVIDGLDAWATDRHSLLLLKCILKMCDMQAPLLWLLSFRSGRLNGVISEHQLKRRGFISPVSITLCNDSATMADIRLYAEECLQRASYDAYLPVRPASGLPDQTVLASASLEDLVTKADGQFLFIALSMKFVANPYRDPNKQYAILCSDRGVQAEVYKEMDNLYYSVMKIALDASSNAELLRILLYHLLYKESHGSSLRAVADLWNVDVTELGVAIVPLWHGVLVYDGQMDETKGLRFCHSSFKDFLMSPLRSHSLAIEKNAFEDDRSTTIDTLKKAFNNVRGMFKKSNRSG